MAWKRHDPGRTKRSQVILAVVLSVLLALVAFAVYVIARPDSPDTSDMPVQDEPIRETKEEPILDDASTFDSRALQAVVDDWVGVQAGNASVAIMDPAGGVLASYNSDEVHFAASLYKLYVAYEGYRQLDAGLVNREDLFLNGHTRSQCLDLMIRASDSPCAEKLWSELGKLELTTRLRDYGVTGTSMVAISTTARDAATILSLVARGEGLSESSAGAYLDSMKTQDALYRRGLPSGFSSEVTVYNKVGWNERVEWHDAAVVETADGRRLVMVVLTENVGSAKVADLARAIEPVIR